MKPNMKITNVGLRFAQPNLRAETGATVSIGKKGRGVIQGENGRVTQGHWTKKQIQSRLRSGKWEKL